MTPKLYLTPTSPSARAVLMTAKAIGLDLEVVKIDLHNGENKTPEYLKLNPQHTVPTFQDDDGFVVWESHAIIAYLVGKYAKDDALYPKDLKARALVDQRLHFETGVVFARLQKIFKYIMGNKSLEIPDDLKAEALEVYDFLEAFLDGRKWIAGDSVTIADFSLITSFPTFLWLLPLDSQKYKRISTWLNNGKSLPGYEVNEIAEKLMITNYLEPLGFKKQ